MAIYGMGVQNFLRAGCIQKNDDGLLAKIIQKHL